MEDSFEGIRSHNKDLIDLLKKGGTFDSYKILEALGIDPNDSDLVKAISRQLEDMEAYGFIESTSRGWKWVA